MHIGDYRIVYTIQDDVLLVVVVTLGHRRDVYER
ncbi:type II toxin-antitoxin system RelE/ParE family toxin [Salinibacterium sp. TMP30]